VDWCSTSTGQPFCRLKVEGVICHRFFKKYLRERAGKLELGNRHSSVLSVVPKLCPLGDDRMSWEYMCNLHTGSEVVLIYWTLKASSKNNCTLNGHGQITEPPQRRNQSRSMTTTAITFKGQDLYLRSEIING